MWRYIFCDIMPCNPLKVDWRFGGTCGLHLHGRPRRWRRHVPPKCRLTFDGLHIAVTQMIEPSTIDLENSVMDWKVSRFSATALNRSFLYSSLSFFYHVLVRLLQNRSAFIGRNFASMFDKISTFIWAGQLSIIVKMFVLLLHFVDDIQWTFDGSSMRICGLSR
jgi:hypothetical protein